MTASAILSRLTSRSPSLVLKCQKNALSPSFSPLKSAFPSQVSNSSRRVHGISRLPLELSSQGSLMPLHSAIASARLRSILSVDSQSWGLIPQGISMPL
ncbi:protein NONRESPONDING TO OXYLIPINS 2, mitochondrial-like isoform X2 [Macadamia integrifolia]|uniref:protein NONRESPONDING TO OXYLIPINS 2, mitochondrial-like isoform X2 n=1 Tax=Macadamia integrifolia TaxID=60698 RepID=UPI001C4F5562|nr:protein NONRESPONDING TO OXYLIPINS 2, mitochondrial-like isoform X2 [Macadamia integrifolia]